LVIRKFFRKIIVLIRNALSKAVKQQPKILVFTAIMNNLPLFIKKAVPVMQERLSYFKAKKRRLAQFRL